MLRRVEELKKHTIFATDGEIGTLAGLAFDIRWTTLYALVDFTTISPARKILLPINALWPPEDSEILLTMKSDQVKNTPDADLVDPTGILPSPAHRGIAMAHHHGYFESIGHSQGPDLEDADMESGEPVLSSETLKEYHLRTEDQEIGNIQDLVIEDENWRIDSIVVHLSNGVNSADILCPISHLTLQPGHSRIDCDLPVREIWALEEYDAVKMLEKQTHRV